MIEQANSRLLDYIPTSYLLSEADNQRKIEVCHRKFLDDIILTAFKSSLDLANMAPSFFDRHIPQTLKTIRSHLFHTGFTQAKTAVFAKIGHVCVARSLNATALPLLTLELLKHETWVANQARLDCKSHLGHYLYLMAINSITTEIAHTFCTRQAQPKETIATSEGSPLLEEGKSDAETLESMPTSPMSTLHSSLADDIACSFNDYALPLLQVQQEICFNGQDFHMAAQTQALTIIDECKKLRSRAPFVSIEQIILKKTEYLQNFYLSFQVMEIMAPVFQEIDNLHSQDILILSVPLHTPYPSSYQASRAYTPPGEIPDHSSAASSNPSWCFWKKRAPEAAPLLFETAPAESSMCCFRRFKKSSTTGDSPHGYGTANPRSDSPSGTAQTIPTDIL